MYTCGSTRNRWLSRAPISKFRNRQLTVRRGGTLIQKESGAYGQVSNRRNYAASCRNSLRSGYDRRSINARTTERSPDISWRLGECLCEGGTSTITAFFVLVHVVPPSACCFRVRLGAQPLDETQGPAKKVPDTTSSLPKLDFNAMSAFLTSPKLRLCYTSMGEPGCEPVAEHTSSYHLNLGRDYLCIHKVLQALCKSSTLLPALRC